MVYASGRPPARRPLPPGQAIVLAMWLVVAASACDPLSVLGDCNDGEERCTATGARESCYTEGGEGTKWRVVSCPAKYTCEQLSSRRTECRPEADVTCPARIFNFGPGLDGIFLRDLDDDGAADLVFGDSGPSVARGTADGGFATPIVGPAFGVAIGGGIFRLVDISGGGVIGAVAVRAGACSLQYFSDISGLATGRSIPSPIHVALGDCGGVKNIFVGQLDADPGEEIVVVSNVVYVVDAGAKGLVAVVTPGGPVSSANATLKDIDGDGIAEILSVEGRVRVRRLVDGHWMSEVVSPETKPGYAGPVAFADVDGDGVGDVVLLGDAPVVFKGDPSGKFAAPIVSLPLTIEAPAPSGYLVADIDGDGLHDILRSPYQGSFLSFVPGGGDGTFAAEVIVAPEGLWAGFVLTGDVDGDGVLDVVAGGRARSGSPTARRIAILDPACFGGKRP